MNHYSSVIQTVPYCTDRTILAGLEILNWDKIWTLGVIQLLKYLGGGWVMVGLLELVYFPPL
jgi:hypothetical protein